MESEPKPTPDELLATVMRGERRAAHGRLKIFLGFAAGVGKTYEMLNEAQRRRQRGQDVVIGYVETHGRKGTVEQLSDLEIIPRAKITYRGATFEEMDTEAVAARKPHWAVVDELAHTNVPGSHHEKRWQDVEQLCRTGINVLTTVNVQHLESLNNSVFDITGIRVRETVPDHVVRDADEVKMVDITPRALIHRLERGDIYATEKVPQALGNWFREDNLSALREIALREIAHEVDSDVTNFRNERHPKQSWAAHDRVMACISPDTASLRLVRRAWRVSQRLHADAVAVYVENRPADSGQQENLRNSFALADRLGMPLVTLHGDVATEIIRYARDNGITQILVGHSDRTRWQQFVKGSIINRLTQELRTIDILIMAAPPEESA